VREEAAIRPGHEVIAHTTSKHRGRHRDGVHASYHGQLAGGGRYALAIIEHWLSGRLRGQRKGHRLGQQVHVGAPVAPAGIGHRQTHAIEAVGVGLAAEGNGERAGGHPAERAQDGMAIVAVMVGQEPPESGRRQGAVLGVGGRAGKGDGLAGAVARANRRFSDHRHRG